jgi:GTPase-associated protein 1, middle domain
MTREPRLRFHLLPQGAVWYHREPSASHVLIDPQAEARALAPGFVRPIELWRAPRWQRPSSAAVVRYTDHSDPVDHSGGDAEAGGTDGTLASDVPPSIGDVVNLAAVVDFVSDVSAFRLGTLGALIDAVSAALAGGPPVVLAAPDVDQGALWIGAVSFFSPPATGLRVSFSTHERLDDVLRQRTAELRAAAPAPSEAAPGEPAAVGPPPGRGDGGWRTPLLSVVAQTDVDRLHRRDDLPVVVIDPRVEATLAAVGGREHRVTHLGQQILVTDWSRLALDVCCEDFTVIERCLRRLDEVSLASAASADGRGAWWPVEVSGPVRLEESAGPAWPLAAAVALTGDLPLALPTATRVILRDTPAQVRLPPELAARLTALVADTVDDAEQAWDRLRAALRAEPVRETLVQAAFESYLHLALADDGWLLRQAPPLPAAVPADPGLPARLRAPLSALVQRLTGDLPTTGALEAGRPTPVPAATDEGPSDVRRGVLLLRAVDLAHRVAGLAGGPDPAAVGVPRLAERSVEVLQDAEAGARVAEIAGPLDAGALARWVVPLLARAGEPWLASSAPVGERLAPSVAALLAAAVDPARLVAVGPARAGALEPVALEVALSSATGRIAGDPAFRGPAVEYLLLQAARAYPDADPGPIVADVFARVVDDAPWGAGVLLRIVEGAPAALGADLVPIALALLPDWVDDPQSGRLAAALLKRIEFLPRRGGDGRPRPRRAGVTDAQAQLLNLLAATADGWLAPDDGLNRRAAEILMWGDRAWAGADDDVRRLIAGRLTVAAFQVALAAEPAQAGTALAARLPVVPVGTGWRAAVGVGLEAARAPLAGVLRVNRYRLAGEMVLASTRAMLEPVRYEGDRPRLPMLPVGPVIRWLVAHDEEPGLQAHLAALVDQEVRRYEREHPDASFDRRGLVAFWERVLPGSPPVLRSGSAADPEWLPSPVLGEVVHVALGTAAADRPSRAGSLAALLAPPARRQLTARGRSSASSGTVVARTGPEAVPNPPAVTGRRRRWWSWTRAVIGPRG